MHRGPWVLICGLFLAAAGCTTVAERPKLVELMWPEPPLTPRIKFVRTLASEFDLDRTPTVTERLVQLVAGRTPPIGHLAEPMAIAVSDDGQHIYVSDYGQGVVYRFDLGAKRLTLLGQERPFARPFGLALDKMENLYVVEQEARRITVVDPLGKVVKTFSDPSLERPTGIAVDWARGRIYVADPGTARSVEHSIKVFDLDGRFVGKIGQGKGECQGCLYFPAYLTVDRTGRIYVTNTISGKVDVFDPDGTYVRQVGERGDALGMFDRPKGVALDSFGNMYVVDSGWSNVQIFNARGEVLLFFGGRGAYPGLLKNPGGIAIDGENRIYVTDYLNYRVSIYELINTRPEDSFTTLPAESRTGRGEK